MVSLSYDVVIIGAGPGGYVAAIRARQLGLKTALVEREEVGGICLNWGCIPTKALLKSAEVLSLVRQAGDFGIHCDNVRADIEMTIDRSRRVVERLTKGVRALLRKNQVDLVPGTGMLVSPNRVEVRPEGRVLETKNVIVATGSRPRVLPGLEIDGERVMSSRHALLLREVPASLIVIGGGAIGVEFAYFYTTYGSRVTVVEMMPHLLPLEDEEVSLELERSFVRQGITLMLGRRFEELERTDRGMRVRVSSERGEEVVEADRVLVAVGVRGNTEELGLEHVGVKVDRGFLPMNEKMQTNVPNIYAIGDVTGKLPLAHVASVQGEVAAESIAGHPTQALVYENIPRTTYCHPQVASVGLTEAQARERGYEVKVGRFPFRASGKALTSGTSEGMVKLVVHAEYGELLGAHLIGGDVTELLPEVALAQTMEGTSAEIIRTIHAHPTLSEALREAALGVEGRAIHV
jgi:dihydrolipoamide dehydrogenase